VRLPRKKSMKINSLVSSVFKLKMSNNYYQFSEEEDQNPLLSKGSQSTWKPTGTIKALMTIGAIGIAFKLFFHVIYLFCYFIYFVVLRLNLLCSLFYQGETRCRINPREDYV
jgi:hypothetical protein